MKVLKAKSFLVLREIDNYIRQYNVRGRDLPHAASDVLDGAVFRHEIDELIRRRFLAVVRDDGSDEPYWDPGPGHAYTVHLTPRAMRLFWPERVR